MSQQRLYNDQDVSQLYQELVDSDIRLLKIHAGGVDTEIECDLEQVELDARPDFYALSYVWGDPSKTRSILVNGQRFGVGENLHDALCHLRRYYVQPDFSPFIWIDAICINQGNIHERSQQVTRMTDIYTLSRQVIIWLGVSDEGSNRSIGQLFRIATAEASVRSSTDHVLRDSASGSGEQTQVANEVNEVSWDKGGELDDDDDDDLEPDEIMGLVAVLGERPWFSRIWTVQEACLGARDPILWAGRHWVAMQDLAVLFSHWAQLNPHYVELCFSVLALASIRQLLRHADPTQDGSRARLQDTSTSAAEFFLQLLYLLHGNRASDPLDQLYGLLGLVGVAQDKELPEALRPDYTTTTELAYERYATYFLNQTGDLRLLDFAKSELQGVPSWVTDFRYLRGSSENHLKSCRAFASVDGRVLSVRGFTIGKCDNRIPPCKRSSLLCLETRKLIASSLLARFRLLENEILCRSANLRQTSVEITLNRWLSFTGVDISQSAYRGLIDRLEQEKSASKVQWEAVNELLLLSDITSAWLVLGDGTIVKTLTEDAGHEDDLVCLFKGSPTPSVIRKANHRYQFVCSGDIIDGPYGPGVKFDESFWAERHQTTFELI